MDFYFLKNSVQKFIAKMFRMKRQDYRMFANHVSVKGLVSRIYKKFSKVNNKRQQPTEKNFKMI